MGTAQQKLFTWRKIIPPKGDLTRVEVRSYLGGMNLFSYKRCVYNVKYTILPRSHSSETCHLDGMIFLISYKQLLRHKPICFMQKLRQQTSAIINYSALFTKHELNNSALFVKSVIKLFS